MKGALRSGAAGGLVLGLLALPACRREPKPATPEAAPAPLSLRPWSWHTLGGILVIEGELARGGTLELRGRSYVERRAVEAGPLRWELYQPPLEEPAELHFEGGQVLATWDFRQPPPRVPDPPPGPAPAEAPPLRAKAGEAREGLGTPWVPSPEPKPRPPVDAGTAGTVAEAADAPTAVRTAAPQAPVRAPMPRAGRGELPRPATPVPELPERVRTQAEAPRLARLELDRRIPILPRPGTPMAPQPVPLPQAAPPPPSGSGWPGAGEGLNLLRGRPGARRVCLTFDGGSAAEVADEVLDALRARGVRTTLFLTGAFIQRHPELVRRMDRDGHEIGNHTMTHPHLAPGFRRDPAWTRERLHEELLAADRALFRLLGRPMDPVWRAPYGEHTAEIRKWAEELGYRHIGWSEGADTLDWATVKERRLYRPGEAILERLRMRMARPDGDGLIVLMHLGSGRPDADRPSRNLGAFMDRALREGWRFVSVGTFLAETGRPAWHRESRLQLLQGTSRPVR